jgi:hypothetical protein
MDPFASFARSSQGMEIFSSTALFIKGHLLLLVTSPFLLVETLVSLLKIPSEPVCLI